MNKFLKIVLFVTMPVWFLPAGVIAMVGQLYKEFDCWIDPNGNKDKPKFWRMTNYD